MAETKRVLGQESVCIGSGCVEAWISLVGGQIAPVTFQLPHGAVQPMSVAPWAEERLELPPILGALRGDFFCMPFGGNAEPFGSEQHPMHGETANGTWTIEEQTGASVIMSLATSVRKAKVEKQVWTVAGQTAIYQRHVVRSAKGPMCIGHHAMLKFRTPGYVSLEPFGYGQVFPGQFEDPVEGGYSFLKRGARFDQLDRVPANDGLTADLTVYPAREGFEDLVMVYAKPGLPLGWSAVHFPEERFIWFSLKNPRVLTGTILWHSNGGRHYAPWSGRHRGVLGIEEVTSSFHFGLAGSVAETEAGREGYKTYVELDEHRPLVVPMIFGVAPAEGFSGSVSEIAVCGQGIRISDAHGHEIDVELDISALNLAESVK